MSENNKKGSRKTKLVPRICPDFDNDDYQMQFTQRVTHTYSNKKKPRVASPVKFDIKIEVEEIDGEYLSPENLAQNPTTATAITTPITTPTTTPTTTSVKSEPIELESETSDSPNVPKKHRKRNTFDAKCRKDVKLDQAPIISRGGIGLVDYTTNSKFGSIIRICEISDRDIYKELESINNDEPKDYIDTVLENEMRNTWGRILFKEHVDSHYNTLVNKALVVWRSWYNLCVQFRSAPVMYKCYICKIGWWNLWPFQEHLKTHYEESLNVTLEIYYHVCYMVAMLGTLGSNHDPMAVAIEGACNKCGNGIEFHAPPNSKSVFYKCQYCYSKLPFFSCCKLMEHIAKCDNYTEFLRTENPGTMEFFKCHICDLIKISKESLEEHYSIIHVVRSDIPASIHTKVCHACFQSYSNVLAHFCPRKKWYIMCPFCNKRHPSNFICDLHLDHSPSNFECKLCGVLMPRKCMEVNHIIEKHSDKYVIASKCMMCLGNVFLLDNQSLKLHTTTEHHKIYDRRRMFMDVIVPAKLLKSYTIIDMRNKTVSVTNAHYGEKNLKPVKTVSKIVPPTVRSIQNETVAPTTNIIITEIFGNCDKKPLAAAKEINTNKDTIPMDCEIDNTPSTSAVKVKTEPLEEGKIDKNIKIKEEIVDNQDEDDKLDYEEILSRMFAGKSSTMSVKQEPVEEVVAEEIDEDEEFVGDLIRCHKIEDATDVDYAITDNVDNDVSVEKDNLDIEVEIDELSENSDNESIPVSSEDHTGSDYEKNVVRIPKVFCKICKFRGTKAEFKQHLEHCLNPVNCTKCERRFKGWKPYVMHFREVHNCKPNSCPECGSRCVNTSSLINHIKSHVRSLYTKLRRFTKKKQSAVVDMLQKCKNCKETVEDTSMFAHWEKHLVLSDVKKKTESKPALVSSQHLSDDVIKELIETILQKSKVFWNSNTKCLLCGRKSSRLYGYKRHLIEHLLQDALANFKDYNSLKCQICVCTYDKFDAYRQHMREHAGLPLYTCELCKKDFGDSSNFAKHKKIHNYNIHTCVVCQKKFHNIGQLHKHLKIHEATGQIKCPCCDKIFFDESSLKRHERIISAKQSPKYPCHYCSEKFRALKHRLDHLWEVHGIRKQDIGCPLCNKPYRKFLDVVKHLRVAHHINNNELGKLRKKIRKKNIVVSYHPTPAANTVKIELNPDSEGEVVVV